MESLKRFQGPQGVHVPNLENFWGIGKTPLKQSSVSDILVLCSCARNLSAFSLLTKQNED